MIGPSTDEDFEETDNVINDASTAYKGLITPNQWHTRHAYVRTERRNCSVGTLLLRELIEGSTKPILIGTWKAAR